MKRTTIGLDLAKRVFQVHAVDANTGEMVRVALKRSQVLRFFANRVPAVVAMEACGSAQYWARELLKLGHEVRLIAAQFVRPFVKTNKTDAADAEGIWEAAQRPGMRCVPRNSRLASSRTLQLRALSSEAQQESLALNKQKKTGQTA
jgi:transposase